MSEIDRAWIRVRRARRWRQAQEVSLGISFEHIPMGTTLDTYDRRRPWSIWRVTLHLLVLKVAATVTTWTD